MCCSFSRRQAALSPRRAARKFHKRMRALLVSFSSYFRRFYSVSQRILSSALSRLRSCLPSSAFRRFRPGDMSRSTCFLSAAEAQSFLLASASRGIRSMSSTSWRRSASIASRSFICSSFSCSLLRQVIPRVSPRPLRFYIQVASKQRDIYVGEPLQNLLVVYFLSAFVLRHPHSERNAEEQQCDTRQEHRQEDEGLLVCSTLTAVCAGEVHTPGGVRVITYPRPLRFF